MSDYKENHIPGTMTTYQRCNQITIQNPHQQLDAANVSFSEEIIKILPDGEVLTIPFHGDRLLVEFDPSKIINLRNPITWELTGQTITMGEIYSIIASAYWHFANERDGNG